MTDSLSSIQPLILRPDVVATVLEDGAVLLDLDTKYFYSVNSTGWLILQLFEAGATPAQALAACQAWGADQTHQEAIASFIEALLADKLISPDGAEACETSIEWQGDWTAPVLQKQKEPLQRLLTSAFDPSMPLAE